MKMLRRMLALGLMLLSLGAWAQNADPQKVVMETAETVLAEVTAQKVALEANPGLIYPLVQRTVLPKFDFRAMTASAMGRFWRKASDQQKQQLINEFRELLVRTYATALLSYSGQTIDYPPVKVPENAKKVMVPTKIRAGGPPIPINYRLKLKADGHWLVYDVVIDGISLVTNYRSSFNNEIRKGASRAKDRSQRIPAGIDALIAALADKNDKAGK